MFTARDSRRKTRKTPEPNATPCRLAPLDAPIRILAWAGSAWKLHAPAIDMSRIATVQLIGRLAFYANWSVCFADGRAEKNIDDLVGNLNQTFRRLRQTSIDEELFDVLAGYESLSKGKTRRGRRRG
jgi:hypothetical protein